MPREREPFGLYPRKMKDGKKIWYYRTYDEFDRRTTGKSTGERSKAKARIYCLKLFKENALIPNPTVKLKDYIEQKKFFQFGECEYCIENGTSKSHASRSYLRIKNHISPIMGDMSFDKINSKVISAWQTKLLTDKKKNLSVKTVRECRGVLRTILTSARFDGYLSTDVFDGVKKLPRHERRERGILTETEARKLFDKKNYETYWKGHYLYYTASLLACFTGMRQGEILGLTPDKIFKNHIYVNASWGEGKLGPTKTKETRKVYVKKEVMAQLRSIMPEDSTYIFAFKNRQKPLTAQRLTEALYYALDKMGIDEKQRKTRNITFHSFRHWLVTYLIGKGLSKAEITKITGQKTSKVIDDYTRFDKLTNNNIVAAIDNF